MLVSLLVAGPSIASATTITFDELGFEGTAPAIESQGFLFTPTGFWFVFEKQDSGIGNGDYYLAGGGTTVIETTSGENFSITSLDLAACGPCDITGYLSGGGTVTSQITNPESGWGTFALDSTFQNLEKLEINGGI